MKVCFLRHGPAAARGPGIDDDARPLTPEGRLRTREAARGIRRLRLGIDGIWTSPLPRARETAEILARALRLPAPKVSDLLRPGVPPLRWLRLLRGTCPVLVGHEPDLGEAVALLTGGRPDAFPLKKAGLAVVELESARRGSLRLLLPPAVLRFAGRS